MKKFILIIVLLTITFVISAQAQTNASKMPAQAQQAIDKALADPSVSTGFLWAVNEDPQVVKLVAYAPIVVRLGKVEVYFAPGIPVQLTLDGSCGTTLVWGDIVSMDCDDDGDRRSCCGEIAETLLQYRESEFWVAFQVAIQPKKK